jgi:hypothetical protein
MDQIRKVTKTNDIFIYLSNFYRNREILIQSYIHQVNCIGKTIGENSILTEENEQLEKLREAFATTDKELTQKYSISVK